MITVKDLIYSLQDRNPEARVFLMTQRKDPRENYLAGLVGREEMTDQRYRFEPGVRTDDVFFVVGKQIRPGSLSAWLVAESRALQALADDESPGTRWQKKLRQIAQHHLDIDTLREQGHGSFDYHTLGVAELSAALTAAYRAGIAAGIEHAVGSDDGALDPTGIGSGQPRGSAPEAAPQAPETAFGEAPANAQGDGVPASTEAAEPAHGVASASAPAEVSERAPEAAQIAPTEVSASALGTLAEVFPIAPEPAETSPGGPEND